MQDHSSVLQYLMPAYYRIDKERKIVMTTAAGVLTMAESLAHQEKLLKDPDFSPSFAQLMDLTQVTQVELGPEVVSRIALKSVFSPESRRAILVTADLVLGLAQMFEILRENAGEKGIRVFRNLDDALEWILGKNTDL